MLFYFGTCWKLSQENSISNVGSSFISRALIPVLLLARATSHEAEALGISSVLSSLLPQPPGLSPELVVSLAQKRYGDANSNGSNEMYVSDAWQGGSHHGSGGRNRTRAEPRGAWSGWHRRGAR